jgi:uncharacterized membrane protein YdjX (TVP38/TMEM64 family)
VTLAGFVKRFGLLMIVAALIVGAVSTGAWRWVSPDALQAHHADLRRLVAGHPGFAAAGFFVAFLTVIVACIPGPGLMMVASGDLFGPVLGGALSLAACIAGSAVVFLACRSAFADTIARRAGSRVRDLEQALNRDAFSYLTTLKLFPLLPFCAPNIAAGLAGVRLSALVAATALGNAPVCFILAGLGSGLGRALDHGGPISARLFARPEVIFPLLGLSMLAVASLAWRILRRRRS